MKAMFMSRIKSVLAVVLVVAALSGAAGPIYQTQAAEQPQLQAAAEQADKEKQPTAQKPVAKADGPNLYKFSANLEAIDVENNLVTLTVAKKLVEGRVVSSQLVNIWVAKDAKIRIGEKEAKLADLRPRTAVWVYLSDLKDLEGAFGIVEMEVIPRKGP